MLIPSLSIPYARPLFSATLEAGSVALGDKPIRRVISPGTAREPAPGENVSVSTHIDYFQIHEKLSGGILHVEVFSQIIPEEYLLVLALTQNLQPDQKNIAHTKEERPTKLNSIPARSQMSASKALRNRTCAPTCIQMLLEREGLLEDREALISDCFDSSTDLYGVWPLNIAAASSRGLIGAVESFSEFATVRLLLNKNIPLVCSIRFESGQLNNAPLDNTPGHLVILAAIDMHTVTVYDPAANSAETVLRTYAREEFFDAWIRNNGIAYVLVPTRLNRAKSPDSTP